jgi:DNA-binding NtrC family response regulator
MAERIQNLGIDVSTTTSPYEALDMMDRESFDAIMIDLMMPEMDGLECLRALKKKRRDMEVILLSGHATVALRNKARKQGALDLLEKPPDLKKLIKKLIKAKAQKSTD